jgi:Glycosyltransferase
MDALAGQNAPNPKTTADEPRGVLFVESGRLGGGSFEGLVLQLRVLDRSRFRPVVVFTSKTRHYDAVRELGVPVHLLRDPVLSVEVNRRVQKWAERLQERPFCRSPRWGKAAAAFCHARLLKTLTQICRQERIELLYSNNQVNRNLFMPLLAERLSLPLVAHFRSPGAESFCPPKRDYVQTWVTRFITISRQVENYWRDHGLTAPMALIPNGLPDIQVSPLDLHSEFAIPQDHKIVTIISRLVWEKAHDFLLNGFHELLQRRPHVTLLVVGDGPRREMLEAQIKELGIEENVVMAGYDNRAWAISAAADLLAQPSSTDSFSRAVMEAMVLNTPTTISSMGSALEAVTPGVHSFVMEYGDVQGLADCLERGLFDEQARETVIRNARQLMAEHFNLTRQTRKVEAVMLEALECGPGPYSSQDG